MKTIYRGHEIEVTREPCMAGYTLLFFSVYRQEDGYECVCGYEDSREKKADKIEQLKRRIDAELLRDDPWDEVGGDEVPVFLCLSGKVWP